MHYYVLVKDNIAYPIILVNSDLGGGRYQMVDLRKHNIHHGIYQTIEEFEDRLDRLKGVNYIDDWHHLDI